MKRLLLTICGGTAATFLALLVDQLVLAPPIGRTAAAVAAALGLMSVIAFLSFWFYESQQELVVNLWLALTSTVLAFMSVDLILGVFLTIGGPPSQLDALVHHRLIPESEGRYIVGDLNYAMRVNDLGLRGDDASVQKPPGTYRIFMLGDSFTMGTGVDDGETFSEVLESRLARRTGSTVEVLNGGVHSYTPLLSFLALTKGLPFLEPDLIVLNLDMSDLVGEMAYRSEATKTADGDVLGFDHRATSWRENIKGWIQRNLYLTRWLLVKLSDRSEINVTNVVRLRNPELLAHTLAQDTVAREGQWHAVFESIGRIRDYCETNGIRFLLTVYPWGHQVSDAEWSVGRKGFIPEGAAISDRSVEAVGIFAADEGIAFLDAFPAFRAYAGTDALYFERDMHWTPAGHQLMAAEIEDVVWRSGWTSTRDRTP